MDDEILSTYYAKKILHKNTSRLCARLEINLAALPAILKHHIWACNDTIIIKGQYKDIFLCSQCFWPKSAKRFQISNSFFLGMSL